MRIVLDTNVLFDDPVMVRDSGARVLELLGPACATLVFLPVVQAELDRKRREDIEDLQATMRNRMKKLGRLAGTTPDSLLSDVNALVNRAHKRWERRWYEILSHPQVETAAWPQVDSQQIAERELSRRRPFMDKEPGTVGHRDTLIWLGVLELVRADPDDKLLFVTADKGFLGDQGLHAHLLEDLESAKAQGCVTHLSSLPALVSALQRASEESGWEAWREPAVTEALYREIQTFAAEDFVEHWDNRDGGTALPTFDVDLPFTGHDWVLTSVVGPRDVTFEEAPHGAGQLLCTFVVDLHLSGFMEKSDWYADDHPEVDLWDSDWNDHLVSIETERRVRFRAKLEIDDASEEVGFLEFVDAASVIEPGTITLG